LNPEGHKRGVKGRTQKRAPQLQGAWVMGKKISAELRARLLAQREGMNVGGTIIANKTLTKARLRILPHGESAEVPGVECISLYAEGLAGKRKGTTSPATFGFPCPVQAALQRIKTKGSKDDWQWARNFVRVRSEYWMPVLDRSNVGTVEAPNIRVFRAVKTAYQNIVDYMLDEDNDTNVTDAQDGRDMRVTKKKEGDKTIWAALFLDPSPISEDDEFTQAVLSAVSEFDVKGWFYGVDWNILSAIYEALTNESIPDSFLEHADEMPKADERSEDGEDAVPARSVAPSRQPVKPKPGAAKPGAAKPGAGKPATATKPKPGLKKPAPEPEPEPEADETPAEEAAVEAPEITPDVTRAFFNYNDEEAGETKEVSGIIKKVTKDDDGDECYEIEDDDSTTWTVYPGDVTKYENPEPEASEEAPAEAEGEPEEVEPTQSKKPTAAKKGSAKPSAKPDLKRRLNGGKGK
jgi:hypothetical protein